MLIGDTTDKTQMVFYNGSTEADGGGPCGLNALGTEHLHPIVARGVLLDIAGAGGVEMVDAGGEITMADFAFAPGDVVIFQTGWDSLWKVDDERYNAGEPGIGAEVALWLSDEVQASIVGATGSIDAPVAIE